MDATIGALFVAALSVIATPITAWLTFRWGRDQERERLANERAVEAERWQRDQRLRKVLRGEDAAGRLLEVVDETAIRMSAIGTKQSDIKSAWHEIRRLSELLTDDAVRDRMFQVADAFYYYPAAREADRYLQMGSAGHTAADAGHAAIRAYLHDRPLPELPRLDRLLALQELGSEQIQSMLDEEEMYDPLAEPKTKHDRQITGE